MPKRTDIQTILIIGAGPGLHCVMGLKVGWTFQRREE